MHQVFGPVRTCIGCRERTSKSELLRLVWQESAVQVDPRQVEPGRGAYLHPRIECLDLAVRRKAVSRALRIPGADSSLASARRSVAATLNEAGEWA